MSIDEPVAVAEYDPASPALFFAERDRIGTALAVPFGQLEHIGSTAVPGLAGKAVIDIMLGLTAWPPDEFVIKSLRGSATSLLVKRACPGVCISGCADQPTSTCMQFTLAATIG